jgi:hypothetical protein
VAKGILSCLSKKLLQKQYSKNKILLEKFRVTIKINVWGRPTMLIKWTG